MQLQQLYGGKVSPVFVELGVERMDPKWLINLVAWTDHQLFKHFRLAQHSLNFTSND